MNEHVHPAFAGVLNNFARTSASPPLKCRVEIKTADCIDSYVGVFHSTCDAVEDAMNRAWSPECKINVKVVK